MISSLLRSRVALYRFSEQKAESYESQAIRKQTQRANVSKHGQLIGPIINHIESETFREEFKLKKYIHKHGWSCLHSWMLQYRTYSSNCTLRELPIAHVMRWRLKWDVVRHNRNQVSSYTDKMEKGVYHELCRIKNVTDFALDDYYFYGFRAKSMAQILSEDVGLMLGINQGEESVSIEKVQRYVQEKLSKLKQTSLVKISKGGFDWSQ